MARMLDELIQAHAISCKAFFKKFPKGPYKATIEEVDMRTVKKGGDEVMALNLKPYGVWIVCNRTNAEVLAEKFGRDVDDWAGKKINIGKQKTGYQGQDGFKLTP